MSIVIGSLAVDIMKGQIEYPGVESDVWVTPGIDGYGIQDKGNSDAVSEPIQTIRFITTGASDADSYVALARSLQGTVLSVTDQWGLTWAAVFVKKVDATNAKQPCIYQGATAVMVSLKWTLINVDTQPGSGDGGDTD